MKNAIIMLLVFVVFITAFLCVLVGCGMDPANATYPWDPTHPVRIQKDAAPDVSVEPFDAGEKDQ